MSRFPKPSFHRRHIVSLGYSSFILVEIDVNNGQYKMKTTGCRLGLKIKSEGVALFDTRYIINI